MDYTLFQFKSFTKNHLSAMKNPVGVMKYFNKEVSKNAIYGPFDTQPFKNMHFSPLMARPKPDGDSV